MNQINVLKWRMGFTLLERTNHGVELTPAGQFLDMPNIYDAEAFNQCEQLGYLMETPEVWADVHPSLVTLPMEWEYTIPYGVVYAKQSSATFTEFIRLIKRYIK